MYGNTFYDPAYNIDRLNKRKEEIDSLIRSYQNMNTQTPVNNFINTNLSSDNLYEIKKLNDGDEVENILIARDSIFLGNNRMQIKKLDGTIEKYNIEKYYPIDEKDEKIKELNMKVEELERKLNNEHTKSNGSVRESDKSNTNDDEYVEPKSKTTSKSISK